MAFTFTRQRIPEVILIEPKVFADSRGYFFEAYKHDEISKIIGHSPEAQDNQSQSAKGTLRGLHYQLAPYEQGKLMRVIRGKIFDVAVDIRLGSPTYGQWVSAELDAATKQMLWIPPGFAHGFMALEDETEIFYKQTAEYTPEHERGIIWNDPTLNIKWPIAEPILSERDKTHPLLEAAEKNSRYLAPKEKV